MKEIWKTCLAFPLLQASNKGRVRSSVTWKLLTIYNTKRGYLQVFVEGGKRIHVHRLVMEAFEPERPFKYEINHKNGNKADNRLKNLEWVSHSENQRHAIQTGLLKFTPERSAKISKALSGKNNPMYGKNGSENPMWGRTHTPEARNRISQSQKGHKNSRGVLNGMAKLNLALVNTIRERHERGETGRELAKAFGVSPMTISRIVNNQLWKENI